MQHNQLIEALEKAEVNGDDLLKWLKSVTVYHLLRHGVKSPSSSGVDELEGHDYFDLYDLSVELLKQEKK